LLSVLRFELKSLQMPGPKPHPQPFLLLAYFSDGVSLCQEDHDLPTSPQFSWDCRLHHYYWSFNLKKKLNNCHSRVKFMKFSWQESCFGLKDIYVYLQISRFCCIVLLVQYAVMILQLLGQSRELIRSFITKERQPKTNTIKFQILVLPYDPARPY
jgi:hypothetical protein